MNPIRLARPAPQLSYAVRRAVAVVRSSTDVVFETWDARAGLMADRPLGTFELPTLEAGRGNPLTGPLAVEEAAVGDALRITITRIDCGPKGWLAGIAERNAASPGAIPGSLGWSCEVGRDSVRLSDELELPLAPMVGSIGVASAAAPPSHAAGPYGGNMDHPLVGPGATLLLPVLAPGGLLYMGDAHAAQGDGEVSGTGVEVPAEIAARIELVRRASLDWPWAATADRVAVLTAGATFEEARRAALDAMLAAIGRDLTLSPAAALALLSAAGELRLGQAAGHPVTTLRLELPRALGVGPSGLL